MDNQKIFNILRGYYQNDAFYPQGKGPITEDQLLEMIGFKDMEEFRVWFEGIKDPSIYTEEWCPGKCCQSLLGNLQKRSGMGKIKPTYHMDTCDSAKRQFEENHRKWFEDFRNKIEREGIKNEKGYYNYEGAMYCVEYPFIIKAFMGGKFKFYGIDPKEIYIDFADVPDLYDFIKTYKK